jgi:hypothetical protein
VLKVIAEIFLYVYTDFKFLGAVPYDFDDLPQLGISNLDLDELYNRGIYKLGIVFNLDEHYKSGSHWVSAFFDIKNDRIYYFDSYGYKPKKRITDLIKRISIWCYKRHILGIGKNDTNDDFNTESNFMKANKNKYEKIMNIEYNKTRHQFKNSECGVYSINFILRLAKGETFDDITNNITDDDDINKCREDYFVNKLT